MIVDGCYVKSDGDTFLTTIESRGQRKRWLLFCIMMGKVVNKLANYILGAYYVYTTGGFCAIFIPNLIKQKNPLDLYGGCPF